MNRIREIENRIKHDEDITPLEIIELIDELLALKARRSTFIMLLTYVSIASLMLVIVFLLP